MTAEELKSKISFKTRKDDLGNIVVTGGLILSYEERISRHEKYQSTALDFVKKHIREEIARNVYGWQQQELFEALDEYMQWHQPMDMEKAYAARERLLKAARYQDSSPKKEGR